MLIWHVDEAAGDNDDPARFMVDLEEAGSQFDLPLLQGGDDALERDAAHGWDLLVNPRRLRIQTLDSLNASIARSRPLSAPGNASGVRVVTDAELESLYRAAAIETLEYITIDGALHDAATEVLMHLDNNTGIYVDYLARMLGTRDQWLPFTSSGELTAAEAQTLRRALEGNLETAVREHLELVESLLPATTRPELAALLDFAASNLSEEGVTDRPICHLLGFTALPDPVPENAPAWIGVADLLLTQAGAFRKQVDKRAGFPADIGRFVRHYMLKLFPQLEDAAIDYAWGGTLSVTVNRLPHVGRLEQGVAESLSLVA